MPKAPGDQVRPPGAFGAPSVPLRVWPGVAGGPLRAAPVVAGAVDVAEGEHAGRGGHQADTPAQLPRAGEQFAQGDGAAVESEEDERDETLTHGGIQFPSLSAGQVRQWAVASVGGELVLLGFDRRDIGADAHSTVVVDVGDVE